MPDRGDDRGTSMTEVMVVLAITALLALPLFAVFGTTTRLDQSQTSRIDARSELDWALTLVTNDIRSGTPTSRPRVGGRLVTTLPLSVIDDQGVEQLIHWRVSSAGLERIIYNPVNLRELERTVVVLNVGPDVAAAPFVYLDAAGDVLDPVTTPADMVIDCTTLIRVTLAAAAGADTIAISSDAAIRSRPPGGNGC